MHDKQSRRSFLKLTTATGGAMCLGATIANANIADEEKTKIREELSIAMQSREARDRMVLFKKLVAKYGTKLIKDVEANTIEQTRSRFGEARFEKRGFDGVKAYLWDHLGEGFEFTCEEDSPKRLEFKVTKCFLADVVAEHGSAELGHAFYCTWDVGFCEGLNPKIKFTRTKTLMKGDSCCNHTYEL